ncbi:unnamed protein product [Phytophthora fragariaefolia]|uniref:Unnamed protein product n=1 Tax=Phytophthora fragariaefolia TaxID=1490495 RepID=A0A9W6TLV8_9STRA|nr:unnamed protein product [Phytophthora fragariaefolia]
MGVNESTSMKTSNPLCGATAAFGQTVRFHALLGPPSHIKAMTIHARETIYVLEVQTNDMARIQAYAYGDRPLKTGKSIQTGTINRLSTTTGLQLLQELISSGILPIVLVLRWKPSDNHFQAVTYDPEGYRCYSDQLEHLVNKRNQIIVNYGGQILDGEPYDRIETAKAAAKVLKAMRKEVPQMF